MHTENLTAKKRSSESRHDGNVEDVRYYGVIPDQVLGEMTSEIIEQYYLWDEVAKKEVERHPQLIIPLIREVFHKAYPEDVEIRCIATEYVVRRIHKEGGSTLNSIFADIAVQIGERDIYHLECQMNKDKGMVLRMLEYDIHIGLTYGIGEDGKQNGVDIRHELVLPRSVILYLDGTEHRSMEEACLIRFADGTTHEYRIPVVHVQSYTTQMIEEKHLNMLIPFLPIRFRKYFNREEDSEKKTISEDAGKGLTELVRECIMILDREKENGTLTGDAERDVMELLGVTCGYLLKNEPELKKEVHGIMKPLIMLQSERMEYEIQRITEQMQHKIKTENETAIQKSVEKFRVSGQSRQEVKENIQDIFSLNEEEAEEKVEKYWKQ